MVESDGRTNQAVLGFFDRLGYSAHVWNGHELVAFADQAPQNIIFLPVTATA
jgi:hypothetical protein